jgi:cold shock CspA family protein
MTAMEFLTEAKSTGQVKWLGDPKGYGFIKVETDKDVVVYHSAIQGVEFKPLYY